MKGCWIERRVNRNRKIVAASRRMLNKVLKIQDVTHQYIVADRYRFATHCPVSRRNSEVVSPQKWGTKLPKRVQASACRRPLHAYRGLLVGTRHGYLREQFSGGPRRDVLRGEMIRKTVEQNEGK